MVAAFDEDDAPLGFAPVERGVAKLSLPAAFAGRPCAVFHAPVEKAVPEPSARDSVAGWRWRSGCSSDGDWS